MPGLPVSQSLVVEMGNPQQINYGFSPKKSKNQSASKIEESGQRGGAPAAQEISPSAKVEVKKS